MNDDPPLQTHSAGLDRLSEAVTWSNDRFRDIFDNAVAGIYQSSVDGKILAANAALAQMLGYSSVSELMTLDIDNELYADIEARRKHKRTLHETGRISGAEFELRRRDGGVIYVEEHARTVTSAQGEVLCYEGTLTDVTERRRTQEALLEREGQYRVIAETASDCIVTIGGDSRIRFVNRAVQAMFGYSPEEITGLCLTTLMPERLHQTHRDGLSRYLATGERHLDWRATRARGLHRDGHEIPVEISFGEHSKEGPRAFTGIIRDVTKREQDGERLAAYARQLNESNHELKAALSAAREASVLKSQFLANMSHEIRTPMNAIQAMSALLLETPLTKEQHEYAATMTEAVADLLAMLNDVLDASKMEADQLTMESQEFEIREVVDAAMHAVSNAAAEKGLRFTKVVSAQVPNYVRGDAARLRQVLVNLTGNAIKFTERGGVEVRVNLSGTPSDTIVGLRFEVHDTGIGIEPQAVPRLFEPFTQADGTLTRKYRGAGLGLTICRQIVEKMGGTLTVESEPGKGSLFAFTISFEKRK